MSRFRRQSLVKPLAAEVLEPRCLMTEATGTLAAADAAPLTGAVVVDASLWDDAGLTLQQVGDLLHVFRTDTMQDVIAPLSAAVPTRLVLQTGEQSDSLHPKIIRSLTFGPDDNDLAIAYEGITTDPETTAMSGVVTITDKAMNVVVQVPAFGVLISGGDGDDQIRIVSPFQGSYAGFDVICGGNGNDFLVGGSGNDSLVGGAGNDTIFGQSGYDNIAGGQGDDVIDGGGTETDYLVENHWNLSNQQVRLGNGTLEGFGLDRFTNIEVASIRVGEGSFVDASDFPGYVALLGFGGECTLIGSSNDDGLWVSGGGNNLLIGGDGNDSLLGSYLPGDTLDGEAGDDSIAGGREVDEIQVETVGSESEDEGTILTDERDILLIGQGIATVGIEDRELAEFDTASSDSAFGELADFEPEDGGDLAANDDTNSTDVGDELELDAALSDELLASLADPLRPDAGF